MKPQPLIVTDTAPRTTPNVEEELSNPNSATNQKNKCPVRSKIIELVSKTLNSSADHQQKLPTRSKEARIIVAMKRNSVLNANVDKLEECRNLYLSKGKKIWMQSFTN